MYTLDDFLNREIVINCETQKEADILMDILHNMNFLWADHTQLIGKTYFSSYLSETYYKIEASGRLSYGGVSRYGSIYNVVKFKDIISENYKKEA